MANIRIVFNYMDKEIFSKLFISCVRPKLEYASPFWFPHLKKHKELKVKVHRRTTEMIPELG